MQGRRPGQTNAGESDRPNQPPKTPKRLPKQYNSDWNTIVNETESSNLFFRIFDAPN